ncbi:hypothetical protein EZS27_026009 [termite gut metagenome]|uniref:Uncharacterized protein n=1 Tax=termite gut metagenome TaxID=433724 RepID=A0A5J4QV78_9ZZZZ
MSKFNLGDLLTSIIGYKDFPYPGGFLPDKPGNYKAGEYLYPGEARAEKTHSDLAPCCAKKMLWAGDTSCR